MGWQEIRAAIETALKAGWVDGGSPLTPIAWENESHDGSNSPWIRAQILQAGRQRVTMTGAPETGQRHYGTLAVTVFVPADTDAADGDRYVDLLDALFPGHRLAMESGTVDFEDESEAPKTEDNTWYQLNWTCPFTHDNF